jgi:hypothetical protein
MPLILNDAATGGNFEIVYVTAITGVTLTVTRAQEGTGALSWNVGDYAYCGPTSGTVATALGNPSNVFAVAAATVSNQAVNLGQVTSTGSPLALTTTAATLANQAVNLGQFASSQSGSGYTKLPNGLIIQWGTYNTTSSQAGNAITFPLAFPNNCFSVSFAPATNNDTLPLGTADSLAAPPSKTGFTVIGVQMTASSNNLSAHTSFFIAIGN